MIYGAIDEKSYLGYTDLKMVFEAIGNKQLYYNWLITDCVCYPRDPEIDRRLSKTYCWISGEELTDLLEKENFQWIWAVLSAFDKSIKLDEVLKYALPFADGRESFWKKPLTLQHPLATMEIVPWDSSLVLLFSKERSVVDSFRAYFPKSWDMNEYIENT